MIGQVVQPVQLAAGRNVDRLPGQEGRHLVGVGQLRLDFGDHLSPVEDHDPIGQPEHLVDVVRDEQDGGSLLGEAGRQVFHLRRLGHSEGSGGLVQDEQLRPVPHGSGHRHQLALPAREGPDDGRGVRQRDAQPVEQRGGIGMRPGGGEHHPARLPAEKQVGGHVEVVAQSQVLPDHGHAQALGAPPAGDDLPAGEGNAA